jgi:hypothetical protein
MPMPAAALYEAEVVSSCVVAALEGLGTMPAAQPVAEHVAVITTLAKQLSGLVDQLGDAARQDGNGAHAS